MSVKGKFRYKQFGDLLLDLRQGAGISHQVDLAKLIGATQQTVSRWESGASRPRDKQLPALARALNANINELFAAAEYTAKPVVRTVDQPFPIDALSPDSFERFCMHMLSRLYSKATVHLAGKSGHTQDGVDIEVLFPGDGSFTFQCKRVDEFGPQKVHAVVAAHKRKSKKSFLLLSRIATPKARLAIQEYARWDIWDKEDISLRIRELPNEEQLRLVDTFFPGQRLALLGVTEPGPWQTAKEVFAPFQDKKSAFNHAWKLIGRVEESRELVKALADDRATAIFLVGHAGSGKSRILKEVIEKYVSRHADVLVRFLSPTEEISSKNIEDLGNGKKLIVVDDAHDRGDLQRLFQYISMPGKRARLLLSFRPYGLEYIKSQALRFSLAEGRVREVLLNQLSLDEATRLAKQVLEAFEGSTSQAETIAKRTVDCPLTTVMGAQIVAKKGISFEFVQNEELFRTTVWGHFRSSITEGVGKKSDASSVEKVLRIIALLQPVDPYDESLSRVIEKVERLESHDVKRLIRLLSDGGVLFKRGARYRLSPDALADYIIEDKCVGYCRQSTGYAEQVFDASNDEQVEHLLLNLGKLDWRLASGDPINSRLLDEIWKKLNDPKGATRRIPAVTAVAYFQPDRALNFAGRLIRERRALRDLPSLIKQAAYSYRCLPRVCEYLWDLGKSDADALNQNPGHAIRILSELCAVEPNKPMMYTDVVVEFALSLVQQHDSWTGTYSPFDVLKGILRTEDHTATSDGRSITLTPFHVAPSEVLALRRKVVDTTIRSLLHENIRVAVLAARFLHEALRYPIGILGTSIRAEVCEKWTEEFIETLGDIKNAIYNNQLDPIVLVEIGSSISWHAFHGGEETATIARGIIESLPKSLGFRTTLTLIDGYGRLLGRTDPRQYEQHIEAIAQDLVSNLDGESLRRFLEERLSEINAYYGGKSTSPHFLYLKLVEHSLMLARATTDNATDNLQSSTAPFAGIALSRLLCEHYSEALDIVQRFRSTNSTQLHAAIGQAYSLANSKTEYSEKDIEILRWICGSSDEGVLQKAIDVIRTVARLDKRIAIDLLKCVNLAISEQVTDDLLMLLHGDGVVPFALLDRENIEFLLNRLVFLSKLDGFWIEIFLANVSEYHAVAGIDFLMKRVEHAVESKDQNYQPCNYGPSLSAPLRFRKSPEFGSVLHRFVQWMESGQEDYEFHHWAGKLFQLVFRPFDAELTGFLQDWLDTANPAGIAIISHILGEADSEFIFEQQPFVVRFLERSKQAGAEVLRRSIEALLHAATFGLPSGMRRKPFSRYITIREKAEVSLERIPRFSAAYELYDAVRRQAKHNIDWSIQDCVAFDK